MDMYTTSPRMKEAEENLIKAECEFSTTCMLLGEYVIMERTRKLRQGRKWFDGYVKRIFGTASRDALVAPDYSYGRFNDLLQVNRRADTIAQASNLLDDLVDDYHTQEHRTSFGFVVQGPEGVGVRPHLPPDVPDEPDGVQEMDRIEDEVEVARDELGQEIFEAVDEPNGGQEMDQIEEEVEVARDELGQEILEAMDELNGAQEMDRIEEEVEVDRDELGQEILEARDDPRFVMIEPLEPLPLPERDASVSNSSEDRTRSISTESNDSGDDGEEFDGSLIEVFREDEEMQQEEQVDMEEGFPDVDNEDVVVLQVAEVVQLAQPVPIVIQAAPVPAVVSLPTRKRREPSTPIAPKHEVARKKICRLGSEITFSTTGDLKDEAKKLLALLGEVDLGYDHLEVLDWISKTLGCLRRNENRALSAKLFKLNVKRVNAARVKLGVRS